MITTPDETYGMASGSWLLNLLFVVEEFGILESKCEQCVTDQMKTGSL